MEFFDRKEEVLEIQLTQDGKRLLSQGEFKPYYYEFYDDDVLYETLGSGFSELQNESTPRIKETPRIKTQNIVYGLETEFNKLKQDLDKINNTSKKKTTKKLLYNKNHNPLKYALGLGDFSNQYTPAWDIKLETGFINTGSYSKTYSAEEDYYEYIPQIYCTSSFLYEMRNDTDEYEFIPSTKDKKVVYKSEIFSDNTYYVIYQTNAIFANVKELNSVFDKENFDIEIFEVEKVDGQKEDLQNLYFFTKDAADLSQQLTQSEADAEIIIDQQQEEINEQLIKEKYDVEWFFSVLGDKEIDDFLEQQSAGEFDYYVDENADDSQEPC
jgi:hypothetical protein